MKLVKATPAHFKEYRALEKDFGDYYAKHKIDQHDGYPRSVAESILKKHYLSIFKKRNKWFYFVKDNDEFIAYLYGYIDKYPPGFKHKSYGYLDAITVRKDYRGTGVGKRLKKAFFSWCKEKGVKTIKIHVATQNKLAMKVYENWGFKPEQLRMYKKI